MRAPVSVIIPTLNAAEELGSTVACLFEGLDEGLVRELVLSDGGSGDGVERIADDLGAHLITGPAGRGGQLRRGAEVASGEWLLFLHADTHLAPGWSGEVLKHLQRSPDKAACFRLAFRATGLAPRIVAGWANFRTAVFGLPYGDQGLLISRTMYDAVGRYPDSPLMEDVAIARALRGKICRLRSIAATSAAKYQAQGWVLRGARNLWTLMRYFLGVSPERLARRYRG